MLENVIVEPQNLVSSITDTLLDACELSGIKPKEVKNSQSKNEPWFDDECQSLKNSIKKSCQKLRSSKTECRELIELTFTKNKQLKKLVKRRMNTKWI